MSQSPILLIAGSRLCTPAMRDYAQRAAWRDIQGLTPAPRHGVMGQGIVYTHLEIVPFIRRHKRDMVIGEARLINYRQRDEYLVGLANKVMCVWNGKSFGTAHVFEVARHLKLPAWMWTETEGLKES